LIDDNINQIRDNLAIETAELSMLNDFYGEQVHTYSDIGQGLDSFRDQLVN